MSEKSKLVIDERPETDVYTTKSGFIGIRQVIRGEETIILLTPDEAEKVIPFLQDSIHKLRQSK